MGVGFAFGAMVYRDERLGNKDSLGLVVLADGPGLGIAWIFS